MLTQGAVVASFGLALATWMRRVGRAIAVSVTAYVLVSIGWLFALELELVPLALHEIGVLSPEDMDGATFFSIVAANLSPLGAHLSGEFAMRLGPAPDRYAYYIGCVLVLLFTVAVALIFLAITLATFNRSMGRMPERSRRAPRQPRKFHVARGPHTSFAGRSEPITAPSSA
jgi:hypothetical protein